MIDGARGWWWGLTPLLFVMVCSLVWLVACGPGSGDTDLQDRIRMFIYSRQPDGPEEFYAFADQELARYSPSQIMDALEAEGELQAERGHPSAVGVLSQIAAHYAAHKGLRYDPGPWLRWQGEALENRRQSQLEMGELWPSGTSEP